MPRPSRIRASGGALAIAIALAVTLGIVGAFAFVGHVGPFAAAPTVTATPTLTATSTATAVPVEPSPSPTPLPSPTPPLVPADTIALKKRIFAHVGPAAWQLAVRPTGETVLEGYASKPSYLPGETLRLAISTTARTVDATIWRLSGREPDGSPFHLMASLPRAAGTRQALATIDPLTYMTSARWRFGSSFTIPRSWSSGVYLVRLASSQGVQSYVPFVVRSSKFHAITVVSSVLTWQAYNGWGGASLYTSRIGQPAPGVNRSFAVSFDRPYTQGGGAGQLFHLELPLLRWIDAQGLDVAYTTDYDLSTAPEAQPPTRVVLFNGHSEYWSPALYSWLDRQVTTGETSLAMLAADSGHWPVAPRDPSPDGPRTFLGLKLGPVPVELRPESGAPLPSTLPGLDEVGPTDLPFTALGPDGPYLGSFLGEPVFGVTFHGVTTALARYTLASEGADPRLLEGTGLAAGDSLGFIAGGEIDGVYFDAKWWGPLAGRYDHVFAEAALIPGRPPYRPTAHAVWRELPSGGRVFSAGTLYWGWALDPDLAKVRKVPPGFEKLTLNILRFLGGIDP
jgi:hypothetical protein